MSHPLLPIDGSYGEGGGQILRSSLTLAILLQRPIRLDRIRAGRRRPGLAHQHLTCVRAAATICQAEVSGAQLGSQTVTFIPGRVRPGTYAFDIGTAGSTSLVFQTIFLPLALAEAPSQITLRGGTHVPWSPCVHYLQQVFLPTVRLMGIEAELTLERWGWYPKGGGLVRVHIQPCPRPRGLGSLRPEALETVDGCSAVSNLPRTIAERQKKAALEHLAERGISADVTVLEAPSIGQGTMCFLRVKRGNCYAGFTALGKRGKPAEHVGREAAMALTQFLDSGAAVEAHLADQLILPMAVAEGYSSFSTPQLTSHLITNLWAVQQFLPDTFEWHQETLVHVQRKG